MTDYNADMYADYNHERYAHFRNRSSGQYKVEDVKSSASGKRMKPILERVEVSFEEVKNLNLDRYGNLVPTLDTEDFTIISNYLVDFWGAVMGNCPVDAYMHLKRHAYGRKDYCYIDIGLIALKMKRSKNTVKGYLDTLEEHGFIAIFHRMDKQDQNKDVSPLFKIRRYIPLITQDMYDNLHPKLQHLHDSFMKNYENIKFTNNVQNTDDLVGGIVSSGKIINSKKTQQKIEESIKDGTTKDFILNTLTDEQYHDNISIHKQIKKVVSKPTYETWIINNVFFKHNDMVVILSPTEYIMDFLKDKYSDMVSKQLNCDDLVFNSHEQYIKEYSKTSS